MYDTLIFQHYTFKISSLKSMINKQNFVKALDIQECLLQTEFTALVKQCRCDS